MNYSYRIFVVEGKTIRRISQTKFEKFYSKNSPEFKEFSDQIITIAMAMYTVLDRLPQEIFRIDAFKVKVDSDGSMCKKFYSESNQLTMQRADFLGYKQPKIASSGSSVIDAVAKFEERKWKQLHPELPPEVTRHIFEHIMKNKRYPSQA